MTSIRLFSVCAALAAAAVLAAPTPSVAQTSVAAPTCHGRPATIVGGPEDRITGTPGADVIVAVDSVKVETGAGDDVVCYRGDPRLLTVNAGPGADLVDLSLSDPRRAIVALGAGADRFLGGRGDEDVNAGVRDRDVDADRISTGGGSDWVFSGKPGQPNPDVVRLGAQPDTLSWIGTVSSAGRLDGGDGTDRFIGLEEASVIDGPHGQLGNQLGVREPFAEFEDYVLRAERVDFTGTDRPEVVRARTLSADGGGGDDVLWAKVAGRLSGGAGRDRLIGSPGPDVLLGGPGVDRAEGRAGQDRCVAETTRRCELP